MAPELILNPQMLGATDGGEEVYEKDSERTDGSSNNANEGLK